VFLHRFRHRGVLQVAAGQVEKLGSGWDALKLGHGIKQLHILGKFELIDINCTRGHSLRLDIFSLLVQKIEFLASENQFFLHMLLLRLAHSVKE